MRRHALRVLLAKESRRLLANRGALVLMALMLAATFASRFLDGAQIPLVNTAEGCFVDYWRDDAWIRHLRGHVPPHLQSRIQFRPVATVYAANDILTYPRGHGALQLRTSDDAETKGILVWIWYPGTDSDSMAVFESWFWQETLAYVRQSGDSLDFLPSKRSSLIGSGDVSLGLVTGLMLFAAFFVNVYLMPSLQAEEVEKGLLQAQLLAPVSFAEFFASKLLFYVVWSLSLAAVMAGLAKPDVLASPSFWLALLTVGLGSWGQGLVVASLARSQRGAGLLALSYLLAVTCLLALLGQAGMPEARQLIVEFHYPRLLHAALSDPTRSVAWDGLTAPAILSLSWCVASVVFFRLRVWR